MTNNLLNGGILLLACLLACLLNSNRINPLVVVDCWRNQLSFAQRCFFKAQLLQLLDYAVLRDVGSSLLAQELNYDGRRSVLAALLQYCSSESQGSKQQCCERHGRVFSFTVRFASTWKSVVLKT